jgi:hypothetical protein
MTTKATACADGNVRAVARERFAMFRDEVEAHAE